jgi:parallel beta-helix repeat protein
MAFPSAALNHCQGIEQINRRSQRRGEMSKNLSILGLLAVFLVTSFWFGATPVRGTGFAVNSSADDANAHDWLPGDGMCADSLGRCTLRAAIEEANDWPGADTITFQTAMNIYINAGEGVLPSIDETVTIDASSVWDSVDDVPGVMINGQGGSFAGLYVGASSCQIYGLYITYFGGDGILVVSAANWIGGSGAGQRNVLSGNDTGISLYGPSAQNNVLHNNYIGLTPAGNTKNPNDTGLYIGNGAVDNIVGGNAAGHVNYISGNTYDGVLIDGTGTDNNWLGGNAIGLGTDLSNLGNGAWGIRIRNWAANTVIGGASGSGNVIGYSTYSGIYAQNASGTQITDNLISGNGSDGIDIADSTACIVSDNLIGGNALNGVRVEGASAAGNLIWPNSIFGNGAKGIYLQNGGNMGIAAPVISNASQWGASGTTCAFCKVALYSDASDEGQIYHDISDPADAGGNWSYVGGPLTGPNLTATSIDGSGNTSEFSSPFAITSPHRVFLPLVGKNH